MQTPRVEPTFVAIRIALSEALKASHEDNEPWRIAQRYVAQRDGKRYDKRDREALYELIKRPFDPATGEDRTFYTTESGGGIGINFKWSRTVDGLATYWERGCYLIESKGDKRFDLAYFCKANAHMLSECDERNAARVRLRTDGAAEVDGYVRRIVALYDAIAALKTNRDDDHDLANLAPVGQIMESVIDGALIDMIGNVSASR